MIHDLKPYPAYKDSGVPWLGEVPEHWDVVPNRALLKLKKKLVGTSSANYTLLSLTKQGIIARDLENPEGKFPASFDTYQEVKSGDLIFCLFDIDETPRAVGLSSLEGMITGAYTIFECANSTAIKFIYLFYLAMDNGKHLKPLYTGLRKVITKSTFLSAKMPLPPSDEQFAIVRYLDYMDRHIRRYIRAKQKLIKLLEEQKQVIIHQAAICGLDPNVQLKPSGMEWLGDIPENWDIVRLKSLVSRIDQGVSPQAESYLAKDDGSWGVLKAGCVNHGIFRDAEHKRLPDSFIVDSRLAVSIGDVLISRASGSPQLVGSVGRVDSLRYRLILSDKIFRPIFRSEQIVNFIVIAMSSRYFRTQVEQAISGAEGLANNLPLSSLRDFVIVLPPSEEAEDIAQSLRVELNRTEQLISNTQQEISLLREYRTRLIADVVTGKLDVREAEASLPEETEEIETFDDALAEDNGLENNELEDEQAGEIGEEVLV